MGEHHDDPEILLRTLAPQVLGAVVRRFGDFSSAEDAVQEALVAAAAQWPDRGVPDDPQASLIRDAARRLTDGVRSDIARRRREGAVAAATWRDAVVEADRGPATAHDDILVLFFLCAHPSLGEHASIALTLRAVGGLTTAEIAAAFLVPESTMGQRIVRAKQTLRKAEVPFALPDAETRAARLAAVLHVLYLIFSEGYVNSCGPAVVRTDLAAEAIRLARTLHRWLPEDAEVAALLALMLLVGARRAARAGSEGELIPLADQDRSLWDRDAIAEGLALLRATPTPAAIGPFQLQAAIAAVHDEAPRAADTDWRRILVLYEQLEALQPNPMITLNRAIAAAMVHGPAAGLALVAPLDSDARLAGHYRLDAVRAQFHELAGDREAARAGYLAASAKTASIPERNYLLLKATRLGEAQGSPAADEATGFAGQREP